MGPGGPRAHGTEGTGVLRAGGRPSVASQGGSTVGGGERALAHTGRNWKPVLWSGESPHKSSRWSEWAATFLPAGPRLCVGAPRTPGWARPWATPSTSPSRPWPAAAWLLTPVRAGRLPLTAWGGGLHCRTAGSFRTHQEGRAHSPAQPRGPLSSGMCLLPGPPSLH